MKPFTLWAGHAGGIKIAYFPQWIWNYDVS